MLTVQKKLAAATTIMAPDFYRSSSLSEQTSAEELNSASKNYARSSHARSDARHMLMHDIAIFL